MKNANFHWITFVTVVFLGLGSFHVRGQLISARVSIAGGGGLNSTGGAYAISGTIGQPDSAGPLKGGIYSITGGFWSSINAVQTPGLPRLTVLPNGPGSVRIMWAATGSYTLEQNGDLADHAGWTGSGYTSSLVTANGTNTVIVAPANGKLFFRLKR